MACASAPPTQSPPPALTFIEDDPERAFAEARSTGKPIFVDTWALWCHSCLALKSEVLTDPSLARFDAQFVWLSLDVERASAAPFLERFPQPAYPTLWILRPDGTPLLRWVGTLTAPQLAELLTDALVAHSGAPASATSRKLLEAEGLAAEGKPDEAIAAYRETLAMAPPDWPRRSRTANALLFMLIKHEQPEACLATALAEVPRSKPGDAGRPDLVIGGIGCATSLPASDATRQALETLAPLARDIANDPSMLGDDRSGAWAALVDADKALGRDQVATYAAWITFLESREAAKTPEQRQVFDMHRMYAYLGAKRPDDAIEVLEQSARDFPDDYNPPARKAYVYLETARYDLALVEINRALSLVYGPRRLRVRAMQATIHEKRGDPAAAREALQQALREADALPPAQRPTKLIADLTKRLATLTP